MSWDNFLNLLKGKTTMAKGRFLQVKKAEIAVISENEVDYISLTDMTSTFKEGSGLIGKWITN